MVIVDMGRMNMEESIRKEEMVKPLSGRKIDWETDVVSTEAIPLTWIDKHIAWLEGLDNAFSTLTALDIRVMVKQWKEENERINKEHEDAEKLL